MEWVQKVFETTENVSKGCVLDTFFRVTTVSNSALKILCTRTQLGRKKNYVL
jgi:hypothetical protein